MKMAKSFLAGCILSFWANVHIKLFVGEYFRSFQFPLFSMCSIVSQLIVFLSHRIVAEYL